MPSDTESVHSRASNASTVSAASSNQALDLNRFIQEHKEEKEEKEKESIHEEPVHQELIHQEPVHHHDDLRCNLLESKSPKKVDMSTVGGSQEPIQEDPVKPMDGGGKEIKRERENRRMEKRERLKEGKEGKEKKVSKRSKGKHQEEIPIQSQSQSTEVEGHEESTFLGSRRDPEGRRESSATPEKEQMIDELREHMETTNLTETAMTKVHSLFRLGAFEEMLDQYPSYIKTGIVSAIIFIVAIVIITLFELTTYALSTKKVIKVKMVSDKGYLYDDENQMYLLYNPRFFSPLAILGYSNINDKTTSTLIEDQLYEITVFSNSIKRIVIVEE